MGQRLGYFAIDDPEKRLVERDAYLCCHCQRLCVVQPASRSVFVAPVFGLRLAASQERAFVAEPGYCKSCDAKICGKQSCSRACIPVEARLEFEEGIRNAWRSTDIEGW